MQSRIDAVEMLQRKAVRFVCNDFVRLSSVTSSLVNQPLFFLYIRTGKNFVRIYKKKGAGSRDYVTSMLEHLGWDTHWNKDETS